MSRIKTLLPFLILLLCLASAPGCWAGGYTYGASQRTVNAGIIENGAVHAPYVFYILNQRSDLKPFGWNIVNPFAPASVTPAIQTRWVNYTVGQSVSPNMAAYWEVDLSNTSLSQLLQYDVLYLPNAGGTTLSVASSEKLRRFVDAGGVLWVDGSTGTQTGSNLFFPVSFSSNSDPTLNLPAPGGVYARHPLLSSPYLLSEGEIASLGKSPTGTLPSLSASQEQLVTVLLHTANPKPAAILAGQSGAGQIVVTGLDVAGAVNDYVGALSGPNMNNDGAFCGDPGSPANYPASLSNFFAAPTQDLKFVSNLIASSGAHPAAQKTSHQNAASADALSSSVAPAWNWSLAGTNGGAAIYGNFVYVTDSAGVLRAFDAYPFESLLGSGKPDDAVNSATDLDYSLGTSYDQVWQASVGAGASAPTVGAFNGVSFVFVEDANGKVYGYNSAAGGAPVYALTPPASPQSGGASAFFGVAPAPTYYGGRLYAGQPDGTVFVYDLNAGASASGGQRFPITASTDPIASPLTIGLVPDPNSGTTPTNDIEAFVATDTDVYSEFLGSRYEQLTTVGTSGANTKLSRMGFNTLNTKVDFTSVPAPIVFDPSSGMTFLPGGPPPPDLPFASTAGTQYYGDYDVAFGSMTTSSLTHTTLPLSVPDNVSSATATGTTSAPAFDSNGYVYYTVNAAGTSSLFCVRDAPEASGIRIRWRFRLPLAGENITDADGVSYAALTGYQFVGTPVTDAQGFVYAIASNGTSVAVLCFNTAAPIYADISDPSLNTGSPILSQPVPPGTTGGNSEFGANYSTVSLNSGTQYDLSGNRATFRNFGTQNGNGNYLQHGLYPNLSEPEPITVTPPIDINNTTGVIQGQPYVRPLHTNLLWFTVIPATAPNTTIPGVSGLTKVGNTLFFADLEIAGGVSQSNYLQEVSANPTSIPASKLIAAAFPFLQTTPLTNIGTVTAAPSASNGVMVICGSTGIDTLTRQTTMVVDNNRIVETDSHGSAIWAVDATSSTVQQAAGGPLVTTKMDFNHPTFLSEFATDDYLVADTGNNRCVRFDRAGKVLWELTRFNDPSGLLAAGEAQTLNQPASVVVQRDFAGGGTNIHYLIADSGNSRIVEVTDSYSASGAVTQFHALTWVSHTFDKQNRLYHYGSASYYYDDNNKGHIVALLSNTRLGPLPANNATTGALGSASSDSLGGSIVLLDYHPTPSATDGYITAVATSFTAVGVTYQITNPRFLEVYTPAPPSATDPYRFLFADDNGAFDLQFSAGGFTAGDLHFLKSNYQSMNLPINTGAVPNRGALPFQPSCVQFLGRGGGGNQRYLITQTYGQAELGDAANLIGGEVFEVEGTTNAPLGGYPESATTGQTLSRPALTGPLTQPTFAIRP